MPSKGGYYAVLCGKKPGVYVSWDEAREQVERYPGAKHKKFNTKIEADLYMKSANSASETTSTSSTAPLHQFQQIITIRKL